MKYWAKSRENETIDEHSANLLKGFECFEKLYGDLLCDNEKELIKLAAKYHDYGKRNYQFQKNMYIKKKLNMDIPDEEIKRLDNLYKNVCHTIPHGYLSPCVLNIKELKEKFSVDDIKILVTAIFFHHERNEPNREELKKIVKEDLQKRTDRKLRTKYVSDYVIDFASEAMNNTNWEDLWLKYAVIKGFLNRLDYWASSSRDTDFEITGKYNGLYLGDIAAAKMRKNNWEITSAQEFMKNHKNDNIIVTASTGSGKTEGALFWAGESKLFYTLPLRVSINAIYDRITKTYDYPTEKTALIHSDALSYLFMNLDENEDVIQINSISKMFCRPVSVCTVDQLFLFIYKYRGCELLAATLKYSKLVIDEIQAYSPDIVGKLICGLYIIHKLGGKFAIMTATLPPVLKYFIDKEVFEGKNEGNYFQTTYLSSIKRHFLRLFKEQDFDIDLIAEKAEKGKVLVICNTVKKAQEVYEKLEFKNCYLLHSRFTQKHRRILERRIMEFSKSNEKGIWISTQIVEASLDIDFDYLFTEMCSADSLLQRLGRCYRKRKYNENEPNVFVYDTQNGVGKDYNKTIVYDREIYERSLMYIEKYTEQIFTEEDKLKYINQVFDTQELKSGHYFKEIEKNIRANKLNQPGIFNKDEAKKAFRNITSFSYIPRSIYEMENETGNIDRLFEKIETGKNKILAQNEIYDLTVSVSYPLNNKYISSLTQNSLFKDLKIAELEYDFDENTCKGLGLTKEPFEFNSI
ncbi:MAG: CRISPR-associated helicase Cas3' [Clostridia bacterium]|jgi:CRISPR-associated endonuclease/helicase Cas3|nr:CRISPR-associated helicase Cas3' [Clostridia bacterium]MCI2001241.1 CRISPR-associated helicase Cas3' [Clostridia bacterium]MCI2015953.1 CRISPR-associated helicase Cas3' [Clostridia bacterium]